jgi:hypothetical protein
MNRFQGRSERNWAGITVPAVLLLALVADGLSRFMSLDPFSIRSWEAMTRNASTVGGIPFEPSKHYENDRAFGDAANVANRRDLREYHREVFTSDEFGYRNLGGFSRENPPDSILVGTSFGVGCGVSDDQTLSARLGARIGRRIYNAAGGPIAPGQIETIARRFGLQRGTVFYELAEARGFPSRPGPIPRADRICLDRLGLACLYIKGWMLISPMEILSRRAYHGLENDEWLPNTPASGALIHFVNGAPMLFSEDRVTVCPEVSARRAREYFQWLRDSLDGFDLFMILVPSKFTVYSPLTELGSRLPAEAGSEGCFVKMSRALDDLRIPYVNLTAPLREAARDAVARGQLLYFRGDTHWNPAGIDVAANVISQAWSAADR